MGRISDLLKDFEYEVICGSTDCDYTDFVTDNRKITKGCVFVCIEGAKFDGHSCALQAIKEGAAAIVVEKDIDDIMRLNDSRIDLSECDTAIIRTKSTRAAMAYMACAYYNYPSRSLTTIGITGTKGKTTTTYLIKSILEKAGRKVGLIGTIETIIGDEHIPSCNTTPESTVLQKTLRKMVDAGIDTVVMEVSSQGLMLNRTLGIDFSIGIFTNLESDHIGPNEHTSFEQYAYCKSLLFKQCKVGIVNADDKHLEMILKDHTCEVITYGVGTGAKPQGYDYLAENIKFVTEKGKLGMQFDIAGKTSFTATINMPGMFSVYNGLCAIAVCANLGIDNEVIRQVLPQGAVRGRIEPVKVSDDFTLLIDYAHNAMALESLLKTLKEYDCKRLVCLFGCGGNRSRDRRFEMGEVSGQLADFTVITSDNPRDEEPLDILADIETGIKKTSGEYIKIPDRKEAIRYCIANGKPGDIIVLAGKGHEDYQEIKGVKYPMDERVLIEEILAEK